jgi:dehydrogenase/reductase SDR family protein 12
MSGRVMMVTGANAGLGLATAMALAMKHATVHMVCRDKERGESARRGIIETSGNSNVHLHIVDLADMGAVKAFAAEFSAAQPALHVLINNAGVLLPTLTKTGDGLEAIWATMMNQTYLLTAALLPVRYSSFPFSRIQCTHTWL